MTNANCKKQEQLGMCFGTAGGKLRKLIIFELAKEAHRDFCFRCGLPIESLDELSIEHKEPWLDSPTPVQLFFSWANIAFSHLRCNIRSSRKSWRKYHTTEERRQADNRLNREYRQRHDHLPEGSS